MTDDSTHAPPPTGTFPAHVGAAILAVGGALLVQSAWPTIAGRGPAESWWPCDAYVLVAATAFLLATAWLHLGAARWQPEETLPRLWRLGRGLVADLAVCVFAVMLFVRGPESGTFRAGLWLLPSILLTVAAASGAVGALALRSGLRHLPAEGSPASAPSGQRRTDLIRALMTIALLATIVALERYEPDVKPWEVPAAKSASYASHSTHHDELRRGAGGLG
jgi:hypothetical protein